MTFFYFFQTGWRWGVIFDPKMEVSQSATFSFRWQTLPRVVTHLAELPRTSATSLDMFSVSMVLACGFQQICGLSKSFLFLKYQAGILRSAWNSLGPLDRTLAGVSSPGWGGQVPALCFWYLHFKVHFYLYTIRIFRLATVVYVFIYM